MRRKTAVALLAATLTLTACDGSSNGEPGGPDGVLFQIEEIPGFMALEMTFSYGPTFTMTSDGKLLSVGAVPAIYPGPLVYPYFESQISPGELRQVQGILERIGLPEMDDVYEDTASGFIADVGTTAITYWDSNGEHRFSVYALGFDDRASQAAKDFAELRDLLHEMTWRNEPGPYRPDRIRVIAGEGMLHVDEDFVDVRPWPLTDTAVSTWDVVEPGWVCRGFSADLLSVFTAASQVTRWTNPEGGPDLTLYVRALHPGEDDCP